jgi:hypothetical protein
MADMFEDAKKNDDDDIEETETMNIHVNDLNIFDTSAPKNNY